MPKGGLPKVMLKEYYFFKMHGFNPILVTSQSPLGNAYLNELSAVGTVFMGSAYTENKKNRDISYFFPGLAVSIKDGVTKNSLKLIKFLRSKNPDFVLAHQLLSALLMLPSCILLKKKLVLVLHDNPFLFMKQGDDHRINTKRKIVNYFVNLITRFTFYYSYRIVFTSENIRANTESYIAVEKKGIVLDYGIDIFPRGNYKREFISVVSKWSKFRNPMFYLELRKIIPREIKFVMAGRWDSNEECSDFMTAVTQAGFADSFFVRNELSEEELSELYDRTRVFVRLGFNESGTGQAILEAIGHGCPVVISRTIGASSLIEDGKQGFLVEETDLNEIKQKILLLSKDNQLFNEMSNACYELANNNSWDNYLIKLSNSLFGTP